MKIGSDEWSELIIKGARAFDLDLDHHHTELFAAHARELLHWNQSINLTAITDPFEIAIKHFVDSLAPARLISTGTKLLDIGAGGGFPGVVLKVILPSLKVTLIDASRKKVNFLKHVIRNLKMDGIEALHIRAGDLVTDSAYKKQFDFITSRALTDLKSFIRQGLPLLAEKGCLVALKGRVNPTELAKVKSIAVEEFYDSNPLEHHLPVAVKKFELPFTQSKRSMITIKRVC